MRCNSRYLRCSPSSTLTLLSTSSSVSSVSSIISNKIYQQQNISWTEYIIDLNYSSSIKNLISLIINKFRSINGNIMQGLNIKNNNKNNSSNNVSVTTVAMLILLIFHQFLLQVTYAGPLNVRHHRMIRESFTELSTVPQNHTLDTPPSTATCLLDGQTISKASVTCEKKPGCRAIQKTGYCCPEYQCECERDGKTYSDGAKLDKIDPCNFCSCRGGEIVCSTVTCYNRDDCEPKFINGTCCPVYDNCPLIDTKITGTPQQSTTESIIPNSKLQPPQIKQEMMPKLNITIKEITKKEEIRIVGQNNPKIDDLINVKNTLEIKQDIPDTIILSPVDDSPKIVRHTGSNEKTTKLEQLTTSTTVKNEIDLISESTDIEINENSTNIEQVVTEQVIIIDKDGQSKTIQVFDTKGLQRGDIAEEPSELISPSEIIYDNTNINNNNNNNNTEFLSFNSDSNLNDSYLDLIPNASSDFFQIVISSTPETTDNSSLSEDKVYDTILYTGESENLLTNSSSESDDDDKIYDTIYHENDNNQTILNESYSSSISPIDTDTYHIGHNVELEYDANPIENPAYPVIKDEDLSNYQREIENEDYPEGIQWTKSGTLLEQHHNHHNQQHNHLKEEPRSSMEISTSSQNPSDILNISSSSTYPKSLDNIKIDDDLISTEGSADDFQLTFDLPESRAPGEPCLIPDWERNLTITNLTEYRCNNSILSSSNIFISDNLNDVDDNDDDDVIMYGILKNNETEDTWRSSSESIELDLGSGSGSGMGMMQQLKERESTTTRHTNIIDIDELNIGNDNNNNNNSSLNSSSDSFNPKDDAESVKYDDSNNSRTIDNVTV